MSARALISGRIWKDPERKVSNAGKAYAAATVRIGSGDDLSWWKVLAFGETAAAELLGLKDGHAVSASGEFRAEPYEKDGATRVGYTLFCDRAISARRAKKEKTAERRAEPKPRPITEAQAARPFDDAVGL